MPAGNDDQYGDIWDENEDEKEEAPAEGTKTEASEAPAGDAKRIADLMSDKDKETARANKAEKALEALRNGAEGSGSNDPATKALMAELREASLDSVYAEYPDLREYDIDRSLIDGTTRAEMRQSATALVALIKKVSTKSANKALAEAGVKPEPAGSTRRNAKSVTDMSDDEFLKMLDSVR